MRLSHELGLILVRCGKKWHSFIAVENPVAETPFAPSFINI